MATTESRAPVVVGIDGSPAAVDAARWAAEEAFSRGVTLRLVHVVDVEDDVDRSLDEDPAEVARDWPETLFGIECLRVASAAIRELSKPVAIETEILWGEVDSMLIKESDDAALVCVGSVAIRPVLRRLVGSTAMNVAERAHGPVAVIRRPHQPTASTADWIVVIVDDTPRNQSVVDVALAEAWLRRAPVLAVEVTRPGPPDIVHVALERRVADWRRDHPHLHIYPVSVATDIATFITRNEELSVQLVVLGSGDCERIPALVGSPRSSRPCSVLVSR
jgi:nucleotide-binding universal stress UspA family protein